MKKFLCFLTNSCFSLLLLYPQNGFTQIKKDTLEARKQLVKADSLSSLSLYKESTELLENAKTIYKKYSLSTSYYSTIILQGENEIALGALEKVLNDHEAHLKTLYTIKPELLSSKAALLNQQGFCYLLKGRTDLAIEKCSKALEILPPKTTLANAIHSDCYTTLGLANWNDSNNELALEHLLKALSLREEVFSEESEKIADAFNNLGLIYTLEEPEKALQYYSNAKAIYLKAYPNGHPKQLNVSTNIAIILRKQKKFNESLAAFQSILDNLERTTLAPSTKLAFIYSNVGHVYQDMQEFDKAISFKLKALDLYKKSFGEKHPEIASIHNQLGSIYELQKKYKLALEQAQLALCANHFSFTNNQYTSNPPIKDYFNGSTLLFTLHLKARVLEELYEYKTLKFKDLKTSLSTFQSCDSLIERIRKVQTNKKDKIELGKTAAGIYEEAIRVAVRIMDISTNKDLYRTLAFIFSERSKTSVLLEAISETSAKKFAGIPEDLLEKELSIKSEIAYYEQKLVDKTNDNSSSNRDKLFLLNREYERFIGDLEKNYPNYYDLKYNISAITVENIQELLEHNASLVSYFIADESKRVYCFYLTKKSFELFDLPEIKDLNKQLIGYRNSIRLESEEVYLETAYQLFKQLIPFSVSDKITKLIIVPDGKLGTIPFESFITKKTDAGKDNYSNNPYLIKKTSISYCYSASLFMQAMNKKSKRTGGMLLCAPINFENHKRKNLSNLPATAGEIQKITALAIKAGLSCNVLLGKDVQEKFIKTTRLDTCNYLHFATHGIVNETHPELSEIYLSTDNTNQEDGDLYAGELYNLALDAELVTLSACQTGLGKIQRGEGIIGLSRALLYAGAKNVLVSLWSVADESTSLLMIDFYSNLFRAQKGDFQYEEHLRQAKLKMSDHEQFNKPFYWAPFILIGK